MNNGEIDLYCVWFCERMKGREKKLRHDEVFLVKIQCRGWVTRNITYFARKLYELLVYKCIFKNIVFKTCIQLFYAIFHFPSVPTPFLSPFSLRKILETKKLLSGKWNFYPRKTSNELTTENYHLRACIQNKYATKNFLSRIMMKNAFLLKIFRL